MAFSVPVLFVQIFYIHDALPIYARTGINRQKYRYEWYGIVAKLAITDRLSHTTWNEKGSYGQKGVNTIRDISSSYAMWQQDH